MPKLIKTLLMLFVIASSGIAQQRATLDQVEAAIKRGDAEDARTILERWKKAEHPKLDATTEARVAFLTARLATRAEDAEDSYLRVALSYSTSPYAAESLLRLGQSRLAAGDNKQAAQYLQRLLNDYPRSEFKTVAEDFLARTKVAASTSPVSAASAPTATKASAATTDMKFTIQVAAFRDASNAKGVARQLVKAGFDARLATVPENDLLRVRIGKFATSADAAATNAKLKRAGYVGVVVSDVLREKLVQ